MDVMRCAGCCGMTSSQYCPVSKKKKKVDNTPLAVSMV